MNDAILKEMITVWREKAKEPDCRNGSPDAVAANAFADGVRSGLRKCADDLDALLTLLGGCV